MQLGDSILDKIRGAIDHHNSTCPHPTQAVSLNPANYELCPWREVAGVPVVSDPSVKVGMVRIECQGQDTSAITEELSQLIKQTTVPANGLN